MDQSHVAGSSTGATPPPAKSDPSRFLQCARAHPRHAPPWHPFAYILRRLPVELERLSAELRISPGARLLDYGCADAPYRQFFPEAEYVGADLPGNPIASVEVRDDETLPLADQSFDAVLSTQVLEHVSDPRLYLSECFRVLRPGGRMLLSTHGVMVYHPDPVDYWRWTSAGLRRAVEEARFEVVCFEGIMGLLPTGLQLVHDALRERLPRLVRPPFSLVVQTVIALTDRLHGRRGRELNAFIFALVAERAVGVPQNR
jgi:SAM-dependent methyltransferase